MESSLPELQVATILIGLFGGLSLFLFGMDQMTASLKAVAGGGMRTVLARLTTNRLTAAFTGAFVTAVIQSSSVTTVLVVGFISAGVLSLSQSVGVIMGANVGTTITAQIIAFKVTKYALVLITLGFGALFLARRETLRQVGGMVMGLGLIFFGMDLMSEATYPLRDYPPFVEAMKDIHRPALAILASAAFTALVQSSSATTGIVIVLATQGFISLEAGIALALGANVGTCVTALLSALGKPRAAVQAAMVHVVFNVVGVLVWVWLIPQLADFVRQVSPVASQLEGTARLAAETPRQIANAHTTFNIANTLLFLPFSGLLARLVQRLIPEEVSVRPDAEPRYLDEVYLETPALAADRLRLELAHLGELARRTVVAAASRVDARHWSDAETIFEDARTLHASIVDYARRLQLATLSSGVAADVGSTLVAANHLVSIADTVVLNFRVLGEELRQRNLQASEETRRMILELHGSVLEAIDGAVLAVSERDPEAAERVVAMKSAISRSAEMIERRLGERLSAPHPERLALYRIESEVLEILKRLYYFAKRMAKTVVEIPDPPTPEDA